MQPLHFSTNLLADFDGAWTGLELYFTLCPRNNLLYRQDGLLRQQKQFSRGRTSKHSSKATVQPRPNTAIDSLGNGGFARDGESTG